MWKQEGERWENIGYTQHLEWKRGYTLLSTAIWILFRSFDGSEIVPVGEKAGYPDYTKL